MTESQDLTSAVVPGSSGQPTESLESHASERFSSEGLQDPDKSLANVENPTEQHRIPEASISVSTTPVVSIQPSDPSPTASSHQHTVQAAGDSSKSAFRQVLRSFTQPTTAGPADPIAQANKDPKTGVVQPRETFTPSKNFGLVGQQVKKKMANAFCCGTGGNTQS